MQYIEWVCQHQQNPCMIPPGSADFAGSLDQDTSRRGSVDKYLDIQNSCRASCLEREHSVLLYQSRCSANLYLRPGPLRIVSQISSDQSYQMRAASSYRIVSYRDQMARYSSHPISYWDLPSSPSLHFTSLRLSCRPSVSCPRDRATTKVHKLRASNSQL